MEVLFHKKFEKEFVRLRPGEKEKFNERLDIFMKNPGHPILGNHPLHGKYDGCRSIAITGDLRAIYKNLRPDFCVFVAIGTHAKLYR